MPNLTSNLYNAFQSMNNSNSSVGETFMNGLSGVISGGREALDYLQKNIQRRSQELQNLPDTPFNKFMKNVDNYFSTLTFDTSAKGDQARTQLLIELGLAFFPYGKVTKEISKRLEPIAKEAIKVWNTSGRRAATKFFTDNVAKLRNTEVNKVLKNPSTKKVIQQETKEVVEEQVKNTFTNPKLEREYQNYITRFPKATKEQFATHLQRNNKELYNYFQRESDKFVRPTTTSTRPQTTSSDTVTAEEFLNMPDNSTLSQEASRIFNGRVTDALNKINNTNINKVAPEERKLVQLVKQNTEELKKLAKATNVTNAKELPNLLKFADQMNKILKNSPANIKAVAKGLSPITLGATGLSVYDLYQAFKEGGNDLLPRVVRDATGVASTFIPGGALAKIIYGSLGYVGGDKLTREAMRRLGFDNRNTNMQAEYDTGMAYPGLNEFIDEYQTGQSGRRYHVVGDRIYAFDTGQPVNVQQAINDVNARLAFEDQQLQDKIKQTENQLLDINQALQQGYNVPQETVQQAVQNYQELQQQSQQRPQQYDLSNYQPDIDLVEQVRQEDQQREQVIRANGQQAFDQQIINMILDPRRYQQQQVNPQITYAKLFNQVAQDTYNALDNFITPTSVLPEYEQYKMAIAQGNAIGMMNEQQFLEATKLRAMQQLAPQIQQTTNTLLQQYQQVHPGVDNETLLKLLDYDLDRRAQIETERNNYAGNVLDAYKAQETARHNVAGEAVEQFKAQEQQRSNLSTENINAQNAISSRLNALTNQQAEQRQQQLVPYQQANYLGQTIINSAMSDMPMDQVLNSNPELFKQVFPGTQQRQQYNQIVLPPTNYGRNNRNN